MNAIFMTGTDTHVGKTFVSCLILKKLNSLGYTTFGMKPIASGCERITLETGATILANEDALLLQRSASLYKPYAVINPIAFLDRIAPHLAAAKENIQLTKMMVKNCILSSLQRGVDLNLIEGAGGWALPLNSNELFSEVIAELQIPVVLVVGIKLGCLNHAILTYQNILALKLPFVGWIANCLHPEELCIQDNIQTLKNWIKHPCLGVLPFGADPDYVDTSITSPNEWA